MNGLYLIEKPIQKEIYLNFIHTIREFLHAMEVLNFDSIHLWMKAIPSSKEKKKSIQLFVVLVEFNYPKK